MTNPNITEHIKPKMKEAVLLLAAGIGPSDVSTKLKVSRTQLYEWRKNDRFNSLLQRETQMHIKIARQELQVASVVAAQELIGLMKNAQSETVRLKACLVLLADLPEWNDWQSLTSSKHRKAVRTVDILNQLESLNE
jgi:transposase-like protein